MRQDMAITKPELRKLKALLHAKQAELARGLRKREGIAIEKTADALDEVRLAGERELAIMALDRESNLLRDVRSALRRLEERSYWHANPILLRGSTVSRIWLTERSSQLAAPAT